MKLLYEGLLVAALAGASLCLGQGWTQTDAPFTNWSCVASSADGSKLVAAVNGGFIYTSTNSGVGWTQTSAPTNSWTSVASSADGTRLFATGSAYDYLPVYVSTNSGTTWQLSGPGGAGLVTCSGDGSVAAAAGFQQVEVSTNSGGSWNTIGPATVPAGQFLDALACSADGKVLAVTETLGNRFESLLDTTSTSVWTDHYQVPPGFVVYTAIALSADGARLAATIDNYGYMVIPPTTNCGGTMGMLYASLTAGTNGIVTCTPVTNWTSIASSADGNRLVAVAGDGAIYTSTDAGTNWLPAGVTNANWSGVASSADGCKLVAVANGGGIYTWQTTPAPTLSISNRNSTLLVSWVIPSTRFVLQQNSSLDSTNWTDLTAPVALNLTNLQAQVSIPFPTAPTFYRLKGP